MATATTITSTTAWSPDATAFAPEDVIPDALILQTSTVSGRVEGDAVSVRVAYVDDAAAMFVAEGADIGESDPSLAEVVVHTGAIKQLVKLSREQWHQDGTSRLVSTSVARAVTRAANQAYIAQPAPGGGAVTPPAGLLNIAGIHNGGEIDTDLDALADALAHIEDSDGLPSHIIASPTAWGALRKLKLGDDYNASLLGAGTSDIDKRLLGIPVLTTPAVPTGSLLIVDRTAIVTAVSDVEIAVSEHAYFNSDSIGLRATFRFGQNVVRPDRLAKLTVAGVTEEESSSSSSSSSSGS